MEEDLEVNRFLKSALEAQAPFVLKAPVLRRRRLVWATASLLAASVALMAAFHAPGRGGTSSVEDALLLLAEADGIDLGSDETRTPGELLLAWQEAAPAAGDEG